MFVLALCAMIAQYLAASAAVSSEITIKGFFLAAAMREVYFYQFYSAVCFAL